ncbi:MAG TPA: hypothetical protein VMI31_08130 [Fimbriimonadaceae bacterium]|nr:hypothetical protein [Fimbriimonadaceae bacterium]
MVAFALAAAFAALPRVASVELWSIPFGGRSGYAYGSRSTPVGKKVAFIWPAQKGDGAWTYVIDTRAHTVDLFAKGAFMNGTWWDPGSDCNRGLVTIGSDQSGIGNTGNELFTATTYDLESGRKLSAVRLHRACTLVGTILSDAWADLSGGVVEYDDRTGQRRVDLPSVYLGRFVRPVWDGPACRLYTISPEERNQPEWGDRYLMRFTPGSLKPSGKAHLTPVSNWPRVVGDPDTGDFAIIDADGSDTALFLSGVFRRDLTRVPVQFDWVSDVSPRGVLGERGTRLGKDLTLKQIICLDPRSGRQLWVAKCSTDTGPDSARWIGGNVLVKGEVLDGRNGRFMGKLELPAGQTIEWNGNVVLRVEGKTQLRIVAYRIDAGR